MLLDTSVYGSQARHDSESHVLVAQGMSYVQTHAEHGVNACTPTDIISTGFQAIRPPLIKTRQSARHIDNV
jgi:hypothetical protein